MKNALILFTTMIALTLSGCGQQGINGYWMRVGDNYKGLVIKVEDAKAKIVVVDEGLTSADFNVGDIKFRDIKKTGKTWEAGNLYKGSQGANYKDVELAIIDGRLIATSVSDATNKQTFVKIRESDIKVYTFVTDGIVAQYIFLPQGIFHLVLDDITLVTTTYQKSDRGFVVNGDEWLFESPNGKKSKKWLKIEDQYVPQGALGKTPTNSVPTNKDITYKGKLTAGGKHSSFTITLHTDGTTSSTGITMGLNGWSKSDGVIYIQPDMEGYYSIKNGKLYDVYDEELGTCRMVK